MINEIDSKKVELWSRERLPFEPKNWLKDMRNGIRESLKRVHPVREGVFYCKFCTSENHAFFDVENVLLYNVGSGAFSQLGSEHLIIERSYEKIPSLEESQSFKHYHLYNHTKKENINLFWKKDQTVVQWNTIQMPSLKEKPHEYWYEMKKNCIVKAKKPLAEGTSYGIRIILGVPFGKLVNLTGICKPLIDGFVGAFHTYNGRDLDETANRLACLLNKEKNEIIDLLLEEQPAILGKREVIRRFQKGIQWNPADDFCHQMEIETYHAPGATWIIGGELYTITEN